jgi:hypothetical protein
MDFDELKAAVRSRVWATLHNNNWKELDDFSIILANKIASKLISHKIINLTKLVASTRTNFFSSNSISKVEFIEEVRPALDDLIVMYRPIKRTRISKPKQSKDLPRNDFSEEVKKKVLRNQDFCCAECGRLLTVVDWDHKDGDRSNNDISNAQALCPTCHAIKSRKQQMGIK